MRRLIFILVSMLVSLLFLVVALNGIPVDEVITGLQQADLFLIFIALVMGTVALWTRGIRWRGLLQNRISYVEAFYLLSIAMLLNQLPMRAGEAVRSIFVRRSSVPFFTAATSIIVERLLDMLTVVIILSLTITQVPGLPSTIGQTATLFGFTGIIGVIILLYFARNPQVARELLTFFERLMPLIQKLSLHTLLDHILDGIEPLAHVRTALHAIIWTIVSWTFSFLTGYFTIRSVGIVDNATIMTFLSITLASLAIAIPISVASIGPFQGAVVVAGQALNISRVTSGVLGFLLHGVFVATYVVWGPIGLVVLGISLADILKSKKNNEDETSDSYPVMVGTSK